jgi:hypothetical protein
MNRSELFGRLAWILVGLCVAHSSHSAQGVGAAVAFDGTNDFIQVGRGLYPTVSNTFTMEVWVNPTSSRPETVVTNTGVQGTSGQRYAIFPEEGGISYGSSGHAGAGISVGTNGVSVFEHSDGYLPSVLVDTGSLVGWTHLVVVYSNGQPQLFINGNFTRSGVKSGKTVHPSADMGETGQGYGFYSGMLDEVRLWSVALDPATIQSWRTREIDNTHPAYANLIGYWRLNENAGTNTIDSSFHGYNGTLQNGPIWISPGAPISALGDPIVSTDPASGISDTNVVLWGTVDAQGNETDTWFEWGTSTNYGSVTARQSIGASQVPVSVSAPLAGLSPLVSYHYRLGASNSFGVNHGADRQFTTLGPPGVTTLAAVTPGVSTVVLNASIIPHGFETTAWFQWAITTNYGNMTVPQHVGTGATSMMITQSLGGLIPGQSYHFRAVATNLSGLGMGQDQIFRAQPFSNSAVLLTDAGQGKVYWGDFNNDGSLDLMALTGVFTNGHTSLFRNLTTSFVEETNRPAGFLGGSGAWGDLNNDGLLDFAISGSPIFECCGNICRVYENNGLNLTNIGATLPGFNIGAMAWADFDNDGSLDLIVCGSQSYSYVLNPITALYRNSGGTLVDTGIMLPGVANGSLAWGDYNNDGYLDLLVMGDTGSGFITRLYRNEHGNFVDSGVALPGVAYGSVAWGDADGDGWLDILLAGTTDGYSSGSICKIFRNNHDGTFTELATSLPGAFAGSAQWGDCDHDGQLDILVTGVPTEYGDPTCFIFHNDRGNFSDMGVALTNALVGAWGDYDNDGALDIALIGDGQYYYYGNLTIYKNYIAATNALSNAPSAPSIPASAVINNGVHLQWSAASDPHTPTAGLTYNVRVGTTPGGSEILSPHSDPVTGNRRLPQMGNAGPRLFSALTNLSLGHYYWSVQTVNHSFVGSPWMPEQDFSITAGPPAVVTLPSSNVFCCSALLSGLVTPSGIPTRAWFEWLGVGTPGTATPEVNLSGSQTPLLISQVITNLQPFTTYMFRVAATNDAGAAYGDFESFTTEGPAPLVSTLGVSNVSYTMATVLGGSPLVGPPAQFYIEWGTTTNHGSLDAAPVLAPGLSFDGSDDFVSVGWGDFPGTTNNFTIELWAKPMAARAPTLESTTGVAALGSQEYAVFPDEGSIAYGNPNQAGAGLSIGTNGISVVEHADSYMPSVLVLTNTLSDWTHVALTYSNHVPRLYVNGSLARVGKVSAMNVHPSAGLGGTTNNMYGQFEGAIQEVRVWGTVLSPGTIAFWRNFPVTTNHPAYNNLLGYWPCGEGFGSVAMDTSRHGNTAKLLNGTAWTAGRGANFLTMGATITGLRPETTYHFRALAMNPGGVAYGADQTFPTPPLPRVLGIGTVTGPNYLLSFTGLANQPYVLETSTNLIQWASSTNLAAGPDGLFQFLDTGASNLPTRFYRLRVP